MRGHINYASITPSFAGKVSQKLDADVFIYGKIIKSGNVIRLSAQLIDTKTEEIIKSFKIEGSSSEGNFLPKIDSLSRMTKDFLIVSKLFNERGKELTEDIARQGRTNSPEAYKDFIYGGNAFFKGDNSKAGDWFLKAIEKDSNFYMAFYLLVLTYDNQRSYNQAKEWCLKLYEKKDQMPLLQQLLINAEYAKLFETQVEQNKYLRQILEIDDQQPLTYFILGYNLMDMAEPDKAIPELEKVLEIYEKWGSKPSFLPACYGNLLQSYYEAGQYKKAKQDIPESDPLLYWQTTLALTEGRTKEANKYIEKYISIRKKNGVSEANIAYNLGRIYSVAGIPDKAKEYCRKLLSFQPVDPSLLLGLAWTMVEDDRTLNEAVELADKVLESNPENE